MYIGHESFLMQHLIEMLFASIGPYQNLFELSLIVSVLKSQILSILQSTNLLEILSCFVTHWKMFDLKLLLFNEQVFFNWK